MSKMKIKVNESIVKHAGNDHLFFGKDGIVEMNPAYPGIFAFYMFDEDGRSDDCTYYFKLVNSQIETIGFHSGTDEWDDYFFKTKRDSWVNPETGHTPQYREYLLKKLQNLIHATY